MHNCVSDKERGGGIIAWHNHNRRARRQAGRQKAGRHYRGPIRKGREVFAATPLEMEEEMWRTEESWWKCRKWVCFYKRRIMSSSGRQLTPEEDALGYART